MPIATERERERKSEKERECGGEGGDGRMDGWTKIKSRLFCIFIIITNLISNIVGVKSY